MYRFRNYCSKGKRYPEPSQIAPTPSYGLFVRHVDGLKIRNLEFELMSPDERPDIILENVVNDDIEKIKTVCL